MSHPNHNAFIRDCKIRLNFELCSRVSLETILIQGKALEHVLPLTFFQQILANDYFGKRFSPKTFRTAPVQDSSYFATQRHIQVCDIFYVYCERDIEIETEFVI